MDKPTDEQIKELLQWCGIQCYYKDETDNDIEAWICPPDSEKTVAFRGITLDFLFKYAVPKLTEMGISGSVLYVWLPKIIIDKHDPALALFWAIWKVIKGDG